MLLKHTGLAMALAGFATGIGPVSAQEQRYSSDWRAGTSTASESVLAVSDDTTQRLVDELNELVKSGTAANAADPRFLQDLRDLALRYGWPWRTRLITEDFSDGDFTNNPAWTVVSGAFSIVSGEGLHITTTPGAAPQPTAAADTSATADPSAEELAISIIGRLLTGGSDSSQESKKTTETTATKDSTPAQPSTPALILLPTPIPNAFAVRLEMSSSGGPGPFELGVAQGNNRLGYRLAYTSGSPMELLRYGSRGVSVIDASAENVVLEDGKRHLLQMTRSDAGEFVISLDGTEMIRITDRSFRDPFQDFVLTSQDGDHKVHSLALFGP
ncbi:MAG: hypothetical protein ACTSX7_02815 [Alphaproteobacteria bacterium]